MALATHREGLDFRREDYWVIAWYLKGQHVGEKPILDGICSRCGNLLFGTLREGGSYKVGGVPCDVNDEETTDTA